MPPLRRALRRSLLFVPGDSERKIDKVGQPPHLDADSIIFDLEDAVAPSQKVHARRTVAEALRALDFGRSERLVRINAPTTALHSDDLRATVAARPDGYVIPKVEAPEQVRSVSQVLAEVELEHGWPEGSIRLLPFIETARAVLQLSAIARADERIDALVLGAEDLTAEIGARRSPEGWEIFYARSAVIVAAAAYELQAIDTVFVDLTDLSALEADCDLARQLGFDGKLAVHPRQVEVINRAFAPSAAEIEQAQRLLQAFAEHQAGGAGAYSMEGKMIDMPAVRQAERLLDRAASAGQLPGQSAGARRAGSHS